MFLIIIGILIFVAVGVIAGIKQALYEQKQKKHPNIRTQVPPTTPSHSHHHSAEYENYIHSSAWRKRRERALQLGHYRCAKCGSTTSLQVHHLSYQHLGHELDNELVVLCAACHREVHNRSSSKRYKRKPIAYNPYIRKHLFPKPYRKKSIFYKSYKKRKHWF